MHTEVIEFHNYTIELVYEVVKFRVNHPLDTTEELVFKEEIVYFKGEYINPKGKVRDFIDQLVAEHTLF